MQPASSRLRSCERRRGPLIERWVTGSVSLLLAAAFVVGCTVNVPATAVPAPSCDDDPFERRSGSVAVMTRIDRGPESALVIAGPVPEDPALSYLGVCRMSREADGRMASAAGSVGIVGAPVSPLLSLDAAPLEPLDRTVPDRMD